VYVVKGKRLETSMNDAESSETDLELGDTDKYTVVPKWVSHPGQRGDTEPPELLSPPPSPNGHNSSPAQLRSPLISTPGEYQGFLSRNIHLEETWILPRVASERSTKWGKLKTIWKCLRKKN
jgi:hypothetical protein